MADLAYRTAGAWGAANGAGTDGVITKAQQDGNTYELASRIAAVAATVTAIGLDPDNPVTISGDQLTFHFSDASEKTVTIPTSLPSWRGEFAAVSYAALDWFSESGKVYQVLLPHVGELPFDPGAGDTSGNYYQKVMDFVSNPGTEISTSTFTPQVNHANFFIVLSNPSGGCAVSIDPAVDFPDWTELFFRDQTLSGATFEAVTGASITSQFGCQDASAGPGSTITLKKFGATDEWFILGLLAAAVTA